MTPSNMPVSNPQGQDPLAQLRDIHLPDAVGFWPPAPGWWLLTVILLTAIGLGLYYWSMRRKQNRYRRLALSELKRTQQHALQSAEDLQILNQLLKRTVLASPCSPPAAGLTGQRWLLFLDASGDTSEFSNGPGQLLAEQPYSQRELSAAEKEQLPLLVAAIRRWILTHQFRGKELPC